MIQTITLALLISVISSATSQSWNVGIKTDDGIMSAGGLTQTFMNPQYVVPQFAQQYYMYPVANPGYTIKLDDATVRMSPQW